MEDEWWAHENSFKEKCLDPRSLECSLDGDQETHTCFSHDLFFIFSRWSAQEDGISLHRIFFIPHFPLAIIRLPPPSWYDKPCAWIKKIFPTEEPLIPFTILLNPWLQADVPFFCVRQPLFSFSLFKSLSLSFSLERHSKWTHIEKHHRMKRKMMIHTCFINKLQLMHALGLQIFFGVFLVYFLWILLMWQYLLS